MEGKYLVASVGIASVAAIDICALMNGFDGVALSAGVATIAGIIGAVAAIEIKTKQKQK